MPIDVKNLTLSVQKTAALITHGNALLSIAGDEHLLKQLPAGNWIAGSIPYFMSEKGGVKTTDSLFVTVIKGSTGFQLETYNSATLSTVASDAAKWGFTLLVMPAGSDVHVSYAQDSPTYEDMFDSPIIGWVSGVDVDDIGKKTPTVFCGSKPGAPIADGAVALHIAMPDDCMAHIDIMNCFEPDLSGENVEFLSEGFEVKDVLVAGKRVNFAEYLRQKNIDSKLPLISDNSGVLVNVSIKLSMMTLLLYTHRCF